MQVSLSDHLEHYGIKGMKWGVVRKRSSTDGRVAGQPIDRKKSKQVVRTPPKSAGRRPEMVAISDRELQQRINRLNMEKQYSALLKERELQTNWKNRALHTLGGYLTGQAKQVRDMAVSDIRRTGYRSARNALVRR